MELFWKGTAAVLLTVVLALSLTKEGKVFRLMLTLAVSCMVAATAVFFLEPVVSFLRQLQSLGGSDEQMLQILFKVAGIGLVGEIASLICTDSGMASMGKALQILSAAVILWLSLPLLQKFLELVQDILGEI